MTHPFFTIGHSTRSIEEFAGLLRASEVQRIVDVRSVPRSRTNPQFNADTIANSLSEFGIGYEHAAELGGLRKRERGVAAEANAFWRHRSFHNYADYAMGAEFHAGLARLRRRGHAERCAIMCAEAVWWRCHRRIIADYLIAAGETVFHILGHNHVEPARMTESARIGAAGVLLYPAAA
jgi:uncharacterized protein (DUF488 family)